jgi:glyoxylase-like metal-dependent hydrolase (beta-lactamase superfamily II)
MKHKKSFLFTSFLVLIISFAQAWANEIHTERYSDRVLIVHSGKIYFDQVICLASSKGLIMIDTGIAPSRTTEYRKIIEQEFGRNDFIYVINTHFHFDHTNGNQVFKDAIIIGHESTPDRMRQFEAGRQNFVEMRKTRVIQLENQLGSFDPASEQAQRFRDLIANNRIMIDDLENNYVLTPPTMTLNDRMTLYLGDLTLKLIYFGEGLHTGDDIIIHCPEEKLLFTGDLFYKGSMQIAYSPQFDAPRWIEVLNEVLKNKDEVEFVFDTHNGRMPGEFLILWRDYLVDIWQNLNAAKDEGLEFAAVQDQFSYDNKFSYLARSGLDVELLKRNHQNNLRFVWYKISDTQSAAQTLRQIMLDSGIKAAVDKYQAIKSTPSDKVYFDEAEFNRLGYQLLGENKVKEAIEIFKMNVEMYPESWNVYDSLGEGYMNDGQKELAIKYYKKSLELNPGNENGKAMLRKLLEK